MTPAQFAGRIKSGKLPPVCLFLGQESYTRRLCRQALSENLKPEPKQHTLSETSLAAVIDDPRAMALLASDRLMIVPHAETSMPPPTRSSTLDEGDDESPPAPDAATDSIA